MSSTVVDLLTLIFSALGSIATAAAVYIGISALSDARRALNLTVESNITERISLVGDALAESVRLGKVIDASLTTISGLPRPWSTPIASRSAAAEAARTQADGDWLQLDVHKHVLKSRFTAIASDHTQVAASGSGRDPVSTGRDEVMLAFEWFACAIHTMYFAGYYDRVPLQPSRDALPNSEWYVVEALRQTASTFSNTRSLPEFTPVQLMRLQQRSEPMREADSSSDRDSYVSQRAQDLVKVASETEADGDVALDIWTRMSDQERLRSYSLGDPRENIEAESGFDSDYFNAARHFVEAAADNLYGAYDRFAAEYGAYVRTSRR